MSKKQQQVVDLDSDAAEEMQSQRSSGDSDGESDGDSGMSNDDRRPTKGRAKAKPAGAASRAKAPSKPASAAKTKASAGKSTPATRKTNSVINLDDDEDGDSDRLGGSMRGAQPIGGGGASSSTLGKRPTAGASNKVVDLDGVEEIVDDDGFMQTGVMSASSRAAPATQASAAALRLPGGTAGRKRQLPLSFSQSVPSQTASARKGVSKPQTNNWDD